MEMHFLMENIFAGFFLQKAFLSFEGKYGARKTEPSIANALTWEIQLHTAALAESVLHQSHTYAALPGSRGDSDYDVLMFSCSSLLIASVHRSILHQLQASQLPLTSK